MGMKQPHMSKGHAGPPCSEPDVEAFQRLLSGYEKARNEGFAPLNPALEELLSARTNKSPFENNCIQGSGLMESQGNARTEEIIPEPFYFVKSSDMEGKKVFINMCGCSEIAAPGEWQNGVPLELEESFSLMESNADYASQSLRFSLSCSDHMLSTDKHGKLCKVYDVVFNLIVMRHSMIHKQLRTFLINMAITWISQKYGVELTSDYRLPRGKYKGDIIRKHYIRAPKAQLVTEIHDADADLQPTFPLLILKRAQTMDLQAVERRDSEKCNEPSAMSEPSPCMQELPKNISPFSQIEDTTAMLTEHQGIPEGLCGCCEQGLYESKRTQDDENGGRWETQPDANFLRRDSMTSEEQVLHNSFSSIVSEQNNGPLELGDTVACHNVGMRPMKLLIKQTPLIQTMFLGCPVELVILCITFPSSAELQDIKVWASRKELYVECGSFDPIMVFPLV